MTPRIRPMHFETRSAFPVAAACVIANGVRETLAALYNADVNLRLLEPIVPSVQGWRAITEGARMYRIAGTRSDAALIVRPAAAVALASAVFGESAGDSRNLSTVESTVLDRIVAAIAPNFTTICGASNTLVARPVGAIDGFLTYFELNVERPSATIGVALAAHPRMEPFESLQIDDLLDMEIEVRVRTEGAIVPASELAALELGTFVPITVSTGLTAVATVAGRPFACGECGVRGNRIALAIGLSPCTERGSEPEP